MKKFYAKNFAYGAAALLVGAVGLTGCSSDDELTNVNPTYDGESVKTQFAINIPVAGKQGTRMAEDIVQGQTPNPTFRGMTNIRLVPFKSTASFASTTPLTDVEPIGLQDIAKQGLQTNGNYKVYSDVDVEVGVNRFLFYGEAIATAGGNKANGSIIPSYEVSGWPKTTLADVNFDLRKILVDNGSVTSTQKSLTDMLVAIASVSTNDGANLWSAETGNDLANYYTRFKSLKAGSSNSIKAALADLYSAMKSDKVADNNSLKAAICSKIEEYFIPGTPVEGLYPDFAFKDNNIAQFPGNVGLPDGSMQLAGNETFAYTTPSTGNTGGNIIEQTAYSNYAYPASLFYWDDTDIKCQNTTLTDGTTYTGSYSSWSDIVNNLYTDKKTSVDASTRSIALVKPINYAVANLNLYARFADQYIYDNGDNYTPVGASQPVGQIAVPISKDGFSLTGILIGDQKKVGYDFKPLTTSTAWTIYDSSTDGAKVKKSADYDGTPTAYSLALETAGTENSPYEKVRFALELVNESGAAFTGKDGIVPAGGKFYLVGELEANNDHKKVFEQDHKTIARVTINSLKSAYNCIPDLRAPRLELGLSVDLTWQQGLVYDVTIQ